MHKAIRIKLNEDIQEITGSIVFSDDKECFINPSYISHFYFKKLGIIVTLGDSPEGGTPITLEFNENSMGEYQRIKREIKQVFGIAEASEQEESIA
ncbi:hypothetical protein ACJJIE_02655 [Microbulbifer sp. TRSA001]|uniref:hypothetical protein n=1 Tax=Microbulbifer sp. TRSA001 TaxID=3243381 RepID=UPI0040399522